MQQDWETTSTTLPLDVDCVDEGSRRTSRLRALKQAGWIMRSSRGLLSPDPEITRPSPAPQTRLYVVQVYIQVHTDDGGSVSMGSHPLTVEPVHRLLYCQVLLDMFIILLNLQVPMLVDLRGSPTSSTICTCSTLCNWQNLDNCNF